MTTIVYKDGAVYSDSQSSNGNHIIKVEKIFKRGDMIISGAGRYPDLINFINYTAIHSSTVDFEDSFELVYDEFDGIILYKSGAVVCYDEALVPMPVNENEILCIGSGSPFARGALAAGASPEEAINIAAMFDPHTGGNIQKMDFKDE